MSLKRGYQCCTGLSNETRCTRSGYKPHVRAKGWNHANLGSTGEPERSSSRLPDYVDRQRQLTKLGQSDGRRETFPLPERINGRQNQHLDTSDRQHWDWNTDLLESPQLRGCSVRKRTRIGHSVGGDRNRNGNGCTLFTVLLSVCHTPTELQKGTPEPGRCDHDDDGSADASHHQLQRGRSRDANANQNT